MGLVLTQSGPGVTVPIPIGVTEGTVLVTEPNCTFAGTDRNTCTLRSDGLLSVLFAFSTVVTTVTIQDCTLDCNNLSNVLAAISSNTNCPLVTLLRVNILGVTKDGISVVNGARVHLEDCYFQSNGSAIQSLTTSTETYIKNCSQRGGRASFTLSDGTASTVPGIKIYGFNTKPHYFQSPTYESCTITSIGTNYVDVASHVETDRSFADCLRLMAVRGLWTPANGPLSFGEKWDRIEAADGRWNYITKVCGDGTRELAGWHTANSWKPASSSSLAECTVWSLVTGRLGNWTSTRLDLTYFGNWPNARWRTVDGVTVQLPVATRLDILRHGVVVGNAFRDVDTGFHITASGTQAYVSGVTVEGGFSDMITVRAAGSLTEDCSVDIGQDMGFTCDCTTGAQTWNRCTSNKAGVFGFIVDQGPATLLDVTVTNSGLHGEGVYGHGVDMVYGTGTILSIKRAEGNRITTYGNYTPPPQSTAKLPPESYMMRLRRMKEIQ